MAEKKLSKTSGFIQMSVETLKNIAIQNNGYNEMAAYIVLCGGVNGKHEGRLCTHGARSVTKRTGISYRTSQKAISWLEINGFVRKPNEYEPQFLGAVKSRNREVRYVINDKELDVAIAKTFLDAENTDEPPLKSIIGQVNGSEEIPRTRAVMDCLILYAALMKEQDFSEYGGVDPKVWHEEFEPAEESDVDFEQVAEIPNTKHVLVAVRRVNKQISESKFISDLFGESADKECILNRYWYALAELDRLQLIYKVQILWDGNPIDRSVKRISEPVATHYIHSKWAREIDPHSQYEVHKAAWRTSARDTGLDFPDRDGQPAFKDSGNYRYIVSKSKLKSCYLIGQLRVRWWAANESNVQGRAIEARRTTQKIEELKRL